MDDATSRLMQLRFLPSVEHVGYFEPSTGSEVPSGRWVRDFAEADRKWNGRRIWGRIEPNDAPFAEPGEAFAMNGT